MYPTISQEDLMKLSLDERILMKRKALEQTLTLMINELNENSNRYSKDINSFSMFNSIYKVIFGVGTAGSIIAGYDILKAPQNAIYYYNTDERIFNNIRERCITAGIVLFASIGLQLFSYGKSNQVEIKQAETLLKQYHILKISVERYKSIGFLTDELDIIESKVATFSQQHVDLDLLASQVYDHSSWM